MHSTVGDTGVNTMTLGGLPFNRSLILAFKLLII